MNIKSFIYSLVGLTLCASTSCANSKSAKSADNNDYFASNTFDKVDKSLKSIDTYPTKIGQTISKTFNLKDFSKIESSGIANIYFTQAKDYSVKAEGTPYLVNNCKIQNSNGVLVISNRNKFSDNRNYSINENSFINIYISAPNLTAIKTSGASTFEAKEIETSAMNLSFCGATKCDIQSLNCKQTNIECSGATKMNIDFLKSNQTKIVSCGATNFNLNADSKELTIENNGASKGNLKFKGDKIDIDNSGAGNIQLKVDCNTLKSVNSGAGKLTITGTADKTDINNSGASKTDTQKLNNF